MNRMNPHATFQIFGDAHEVSDGELLKSILAIIRLTHLINRGNIKK
jgi:hypothetical protein